LPMFVLTAQLRERLKTPLGKLVKGSSESVVETLRQEIRDRKPAMIICVGDAVSRLFTQNKLQTDVRILDNVEMRERIPPAELDMTSKRIFFAKNNPGTIDVSAWQAVAEALEAGDSLVVVDGEEDLLALVAMAIAPLDSIIVYGQPKVGVVLVVVDNKLKCEVDSILNSMRKG